jgi:alanyl aminopeptidase
MLHTMHRLLSLLACAMIADAAAEPPAFRLPGGVRPLRYEVELRIAPDSTTFTGSVAIDVEITEPARVIWLNGTNLKIAAAALRTGNIETELRTVDGGRDFLGFAAPAAVQPGRGRLTLTYSGAIAESDASGIFRQSHNGHAYLATLFEPTLARRAFPSFDEPRFKVPWRLTLHVRQDQQAYSNTAVESEANQSDGWKTVRFRETAPLPSYLVAFAVGPWEVVDLGMAGARKTRLRLLVPQGEAAHTRWAREVAPKIFERLESYFQIPYPYEKLDQIALPVVGGMAMETPGLVAYDMSYLCIRERDLSPQRRRQSAEIMSHEMGHQWFGNLVTLRWWDDLWLNEAFASWLQTRITADLFPDWQQLAEAATSLQFALDMDSLDSARKIAQPVESFSENAFDGITYLKGASVLRMFEAWMGPEKFRLAVRNYLKTYAHGNAAAPEFLGKLSDVAGRQVASSLSTFLYQTGAPLLTVRLECQPGTNPVIYVEQQRAVPLGSKAHRDERWQLPVCYAFGNAGNRTRDCALVQESKATIDVRSVRGCPEAFTANDGGTGYYRVRYTPELYEQFVRHFGAYTTSEQLDFIGNSEALVRLGELSPIKLLSLATTAQVSEANSVHQAVARSAHAVLDNVDQEDLEIRARFYRDTWGPLARKLGLRSGRTDTDDIRAMRALFLGLAVAEGGDRDLHAEAVQLARGWLRNRESVSADLVPRILTAAASSGDQRLFDEFVAELKRTSSPDDRTKLIDAIAAFRDPEIRRRGMALLLDPTIDAKQSYMLLFARRIESRRVPWEFVREHISEVLQRLPAIGGTDMDMFVPFSAVMLCSERDAADVESFLRPRLSKVEGADRTLAQAVEMIRQCAARTEKAKPEVKSFLASYRRRGSP